MSKAECFKFEALDTLFFRESRPMDSIGGSLLQSVFPPPARTLVGAIRTIIGEINATDWSAYARDEGHPLRALIGAPDTLIGAPDRLGPLRFAGPCLIEDGERLYPMPLAVLFAGEHQTRMQPATAPQRCDLGNVRLPEKQTADLVGAAPAPTCFITARGLQCFLQGKAIPHETIRKPTHLFSTEERLGIARDNNRRVTGDGLLYQTAHIRPHRGSGLAIGINVSGFPESLPHEGGCRLGAEGRMASWQRVPVCALPVPRLPENVCGIVVVLVSHALFSRGWLPDGFELCSFGGYDSWSGELGGCPLRLISAVTGKPVREGGWDMARCAPRPLISLVPAGSCYFFETEGNPETVAHALHGLQIGQETEYGRGEIAAGYW